MIFFSIVFMLACIFSSACWALTGQTLTDSALFESFRAHLEESSDDFTQITDEVLRQHIKRARVFFLFAMIITALAAVGCIAYKMLI